MTAGADPGHLGDVFRIKLYGRTGGLHMSPEQTGDRLPYWGSKEMSANLTENAVTERMD